MKKVTSTPAAAPKERAFSKGDAVIVRSGDWGHGNQGTVLASDRGEYTVELVSGQKATFRANALLAV